VKVVTDAQGTSDGLRALRRELVRQLGKHRTHRWDFPGPSKRAVLPSWYGEIAGGPLAVAIGNEADWETRTPILLARSPLETDMTPIVEINVPVGDGAVHRSVNGCFCVERGSTFLLAHRGSSFTVTPWKVPKAAVHEYFAKWLGVVADGAKETPVIPVGLVSPGLAEHMALFADAVAVLKKSWAANRGDSAKVMQTLGWSEDLNFPETIERTLSTSVSTFDYRHGPVQSDLKKALAKLLPSNYRVVFYKKHIDLGIVHGNEIIAIFEVKTGFGSQLYSAIGQLLCYRQQFAQPNTPLFLVVPGDICADDEAPRVGKLLRALGIELLVRRHSTFHFWNGHPLRQLLTTLPAPRQSSRKGT
jgi:hypothetical protein